MHFSGTALICIELHVHARGCKRGHAESSFSFAPIHTHSKFSSVPFSHCTDECCIPDAACLVLSLCGTVLGLLLLHLIILCVLLTLAKALQKYLLGFTLRRVCQMMETDLCMQLQPCTAFRCPPAASNKLWPYLRL